MATSVETPAGGAPPPEQTGNPGAGDPDSSFRDRFRSAVIANIWLGALVLSILSLVAIGGAFLVGMPRGPDAEVGPTATLLSGVLVELGGGLLIAGLGAAVIHVLVLSRRAEWSRLERERERAAQAVQLGKILQAVDGVAGRIPVIEQALQVLDRRSLDGAELAAAGVQRVYTDRTAAYPDMARAACGDNVFEVRILGVDLHGLVRSTDPDSLWEQVGSEALRRVGTGARYSVRILLIDPECAGASLLDAHTRQGLRSEVDLTVARVRALQQSIPPQSHVAVHIRLYRLAPQSFIFATDVAAFVQPFTRLRRHAGDSPLPAWVSGAVTQHGHHSAAAQAINDHFDSVWDQAVPCEDPATTGDIGVDRGVEEAGLVNIITDPQTATIRIAHLIDRARQRVWIQGVSLDPLFKPPELVDAMNRLLSRRSVQVRLLVLDPDCRQARHKSYRDGPSFRAGHPSPEALQTYLALGRDGGSEREDPHRHSKVYLEIRRNLRRLEALLDGGAPNLEVRAYEVGPVAFVLIVDDHVLVEQYHYGRLGSGDQAMISADLQLTDEMCLLEFRRLRTEPSLGRRGRVPHPFAVLEDHYEYVFTHTARPIR